MHFLIGRMRINDVCLCVCVCPIIRLGQSHVYGSQRRNMLKHMFDCWIKRQFLAIFHIHYYYYIIYIPYILYYIDHIYTIFGIFFTKDLWLGCPTLGNTCLQMHLEDLFEFRQTNPFGCGQRFGIVQHSSTQCCAPNYT